MAFRPFSSVMLSVLTVVGCSAADNARPLPAGPSFEIGDIGAVTVSVVGPDGNICNSMTDGGGGRIQINAINLSAGGTNAGTRNVVCPENSTTYALPTGSYLFRARLPIPGAIEGGFPWQSFTLTPVPVSGDANVEVSVAPGQVLGGGVFLDGQPFAGISLNFLVADATLFGVTVSTSSANGGWDEFIGRPVTILQTGLRVQPNAFCELLGTRLLEPFSFAPFTFPTEKSAVSCDLVTSEATRFSHTRTRLVVTPGPGDVGAGQQALTDDLGDGWGVQFPVNPGEQPRHGDIGVSQLFMGGLIIGMKPDRILSANELNGYTVCGNCRAFGPHGKLHFTSSPSYGEKVTWQYSDAGSAQGVGLKVVQKSYDGIPPNDYVLFRFTITNGGAAPVTIYPGFFGDWDIDDDFLDDVGATEGRLMYMTNVGGGVAGGSLIISDAPVAGASFGTLNPGPVRTIEELVAELTGDVTNPSAPEPGDHNYVQSIGPIPLAKGGSTQFWIAIVAGDDLGQLRSNAAAAAADVAQRRGQPDVADSGPMMTAPAEGVWGGKGKPHAVSPVCKKGCATLQ